MTCISVAGYDDIRRRRPVTRLRKTRFSNDQNSESIKTSEKRRRWIFAARRLGVAFIALAGSFPESSTGQDPAGNNDKSSLTELVTELREETKLVGLAAMVMVDGKVVDSAVAGERKNASGVQLQIGDRWHLGSVTKSITATTIARLVESGQMQWSDSIGMSFPNASIHQNWKPVTLRQLLTHTAGAPANFSFW